MWHNVLPPPNLHIYPFSVKRNTSSVNFSPLSQSNTPKCAWKQGDGNSATVAVCSRATFNGPLKHAGSLQLPGWRANLHRRRRWAAAASDWGGAVQTLQTKHSCYLFKQGVRRFSELFEPHRVVAVTEVWRGGPHDRPAFSTCWQMETLVTPCCRVSLQQNNLPRLKRSPACCRFCNAWTAKLGVALLGSCRLSTQQRRPPSTSFPLKLKAALTFISLPYLTRRQEVAAPSLVSNSCCVIWWWQMGVGGLGSPDWAVKKKKQKTLKRTVWHFWPLTRAFCALKRQLTREPTWRRLPVSSVPSQQWPFFFLFFF